MIKVKLSVACDSPRGRSGPGCVVEYSDTEGEAIIAAGKGEEVKTKKRKWLNKGK